MEQHSQTLMTPEDLEPDHSRRVTTCSLCGPWSLHTRASHTKSIEKLFLLASKNSREYFVSEIMQAIALRSINPRYVNTKKLSHAAVYRSLHAKPQCATQPWSTISPRAAHTLEKYVRFCPGRTFCALLAHSDVSKLTAREVFKWAQLISEMKTKNLASPPANLGFLSGLDAPWVSEREKGAIVEELPPNKKQKEEEEAEEECNLDPNRAPVVHAGLSCTYVSPHCSRGGLPSASAPPRPEQGRAAWGQPGPDDIVTIPVPTRYLPQVYKFLAEALSAPK